MKRQLVMLVALSVSVLYTSAAFAGDRGPSARVGHGFGHGNSHGFSHGFGRGFGFGGNGFGGGSYCGRDIPEFYGEFSKTLPYFALPPPVYYSCPVPRTYGY